MLLVYMDMIPKMERIIIVVKLPVVNEYNEGNQNNNNNNDDDNDDGNDEDDLSLECTTCDYDYCYTCTMSNRRPPTPSP